MRIFVRPKIYTYSFDKWKRNFCDPREALKITKASKSRNVSRRYLTPRTLIGKQYKFHYALASLMLNSWHLSAPWLLYYMQYVLKISCSRSQKQLLLWMKFVRQIMIWPTKAAFSFSFYKFYNSKHRIHIISFEPIISKFFSWIQYDFSVNRCDWRILAGNEKRIGLYCLNQIGKNVLFIYRGCFILQTHFSFPWKIQFTFAWRFKWKTRKLSSR